MSHSSIVDDIFYHTINKSFKLKLDICEWCKERSSIWWVDYLECSVSFSRNKIDVPWDLAFSFFDKSSSFNIIHRRYVENCLELCFHSRNHFLWIRCDENVIPELIKKFGLKIRTYKYRNVKGGA